MYNYNFYFPNTELDHLDITINTWPIKCELATDIDWISFFHTDQFTEINTGSVSKNAKQINYNICSQRPDGLYYYYINFDVTQIKQYDFFASSVTKFSDYILELPDQVQKDVDNGTAKLILDNSQEGFPYHSFNWDIFYKKTNLKPEQLIFVTGDMSLNCNSYIPTVYRNTWETSLARASYNFEFEDFKKKCVNNIIQRNSRKYHGLSLNRLLRPHRIMLAKFISDSNLGKEKINYSFGIVTHHGDNNIDALNRDTGAFNGIVSKTSKIFKIPANELRTWVDAHGEKNIDQEPNLNLHVNQACNYGDEILNAYSDSYFSIVAETNYKEDTIFQSEKIFKPVLLLQPFVVAGETGAIQSMRELGYDVFDDFINHNYDSIIDPKKRMDKICQEIERLCNISKTEWNEILFQMLPRLILNFTTLQNAMYRNNELHNPVYKNKILKSPSHH